MANPATQENISYFAVYATIPNYNLPLNVTEEITEQTGVKDISSKIKNGNWSIHFFNTNRNLVTSVSHTSASRWGIREEGEPDSVSCGGDKKIDILEGNMTIARLAGALLLANQKDHFFSSTGKICKKSDLRRVSPVVLPPNEESGREEKKC